MDNKDSNTNKDSKIQIEFDLVKHLHRQREFSLKTFGPGERTKGVLAHIRKELVEIEEKPQDLEEWIDVILLALDGAWRSGASPEAIAMKLYFKQSKNENREWPDWRTMSVDEPIQHVKQVEEAGWSCDACKDMGCTW
jgi:hypothetical protein